MELRMHILSPPVTEKCLFKLDQVSRATRDCGCTPDIMISKYMSLCRDVKHADHLESPELIYYWYMVVIYLSVISCHMT